MESILAGCEAPVRSGGVPGAGHELALFHGLGCGVVVGASRKRFIGALSNEAPPDKRLAGSIALAVKAAEQGAQLIRVHDVPETVQALKVWRGLRDQALTPRTS